MSAMLYSNNITERRAEEKRRILSDLHSAVKACQLKYGGRTELATDADPCIAKLCICFESALSHGLRQQPTSALKQMAELMGGAEPPSFWNYAECQLTSHERERYISLRQVWTDRGRSRALIRAAINERSLERYLHSWLSFPSLQQSYEEWALMRDHEASAMLPNLAAGLVSILFAISVDSVDLNTDRDISSNKLLKSEPIIAVPPPGIPKKTSGKRKVISFDEEDEHRSVSADIQKPYSPKEVTVSSITNTIISPVKIIEKTCEKQESCIENVTKNFMAKDSIKNDKCNNQSLAQNYSTDETLEIQSALSDSGVCEGQYPLGESYGSSASSLRGSIDSAESGMSPYDLNMLKLKLEEKEERCCWLEARVAELSRENQQLRQNNRGTAIIGPAFSISIPKVHKIGSHYEYEILLTSNHCNESWNLLRRYRGFYNLHKELCKKNSAVLSLDFPPKKTIGNMSSVLVEERRQRLQAYLRNLIVLLPQLASCTTRSQLERTLIFFRPEQDI